MDGSLIEVHVPDGTVGGTGETRPRIQTLLKELGGTLRALVPTRRNILLVIDEPGIGTPALVAITAATGRPPNRARLPLANLTSITALDPVRSDLLVAFDARHGAHIVGFAPGTDDPALQVTPVDASVRATAVAALNEQWLVVARKGGELIKVQRTPATGGRGGTGIDLCRQLRTVLTRCGCRCHDDHPHYEKPECHCHDGPGRPGGSGPGRPGGGPGGQPGSPGGTPGGSRYSRPARWSWWPARRPSGRSRYSRRSGGQPGGTMPDDEPCGNRQRANLDWTVGTLRQAGNYIVAVAPDSKRMAVLDSDINVRFERYLSPRGAVIATAAAGTDRLVTMQRGKRQLAAWSLDAYTRGVREVDVMPTVRRRPDPVHARPAVFRGRKSRPATPNPHLRVCVFTVTEPGQLFGDPDQAKMQAQLVPNVYDVCHAYYQENSFQTLDGIHRLWRAPWRTSATTGASAQLCLLLLRHVRAGRG